MFSYQLSSALTKQRQSQTGLTSGKKWKYVVKYHSKPGEHCENSEDFTLNGWNGLRLMSWCLVVVCEFENGADWEDRLLEASIISSTNQ